jgi:hypothetical protein
MVLPTGYGVDVSNPALDLSVVRDAAELIVTVVQSLPFRGVSDGREAEHLPDAENLNLRHAPACTPPTYRAVLA